MTSGEERSIERQLGRLIGEVSLLRDQATHADQGRARLHARIDELTEQMHRAAVEAAHLGETTKAIADDVAAMKPQVELVRDLRMKAAGAILVIGALGAVLGAALAAFWDQVLSLIAHLLPH